VTQLAELADFFYLHNRTIYQRCDDSVLRSVLGIPTLIRRSRGYVPEYIKLPFIPPFSAMVAMGAEENSTGAIARNNRIFPTQHIGNVTNLEIGSYLDASLRHMQQLLKIEDNEIGLIARDLHPTFLSGQIASQWKDQLDFSQKYPEMIVNVQHHHAHMAALMMDHELPLESQIVAITLDGFGYGLDKQAWGGEILVGGYAKFERTAWLQPVPMVGGDLCTEWPYRMLLCQLLLNMPVNEGTTLIQTLYSPSELASHFPHKETEVNYLLRYLTSPNSHSQSEFVKTSGLGRWLDAAAAVFGVCDHRT
jgi:hydrogenase maturation protein HypF